MQNELLAISNLTRLFSIIQAITEYLAGWKYLVRHFNNNFSSNRVVLRVWFFYNPGTINNLLGRSLKRLTVKYFVSMCSDISLMPV
jgi:hypothetical protein